MCCVSRQRYRQSEIVLSSCPPRCRVARSAVGLSAVCVDANAISPDVSVRDEALAEPRRIHGEKKAGASTGA